jgi:hypothetical protein
MASIPEYPEVPDTPVLLFGENNAIFKSFSPARYFVFVQYFIDTALRTYITEIIGLIQRQRETLGTRDCNYDVNQLRVLLTTAYAFHHAAANSPNAAAAKNVLDGVLYMLNRSYWSIFKKYIAVADRDDSQRYFSMLLTRAKLEFDYNPAYTKYKGGLRGYKKRNCTYKRKGRKGRKGRKAPKTRRH